MFIFCLIHKDISVSEAVDWEHFYLGQSREQDHFLAVASGLGKYLIL